LRSYDKDIIDQVTVPHRDNDDGFVAVAPA
jgi:hypothetical protein